MSNLVEIKKELNINANDVEGLMQSQQVVKEFVTKSLVEGIDNDYGKVPGVKKKMLFKPGAEKLCKLFGFSSSVTCIEKIISPEENFAMFTYKCQIIHIKTGAVIAECEGVCNSQEDKYREKSVYKNGKYAGKEPVSAMNILNTLMKMAQKRAFVGATILATGASDYFTQDEDEIAYQKEDKNQVVTDDKFKDVTPASELANYVVKVGKHKDKTLGEIGAKELTNYLAWITKTQSNPTGPLLEVLNKGREFLRTA